MNYQFDKINTLKYATEDNASRYRAIMRFFYQEHEKLRHYSAPTDVFRFLQDNNIIAEDFTDEQLQRDLKQLENWDCLTSRQDKDNIFTIKEFKERKFRYQITPLAAEIERTLIRFDEMDEALAPSLESSLFQRLWQAIDEINNKSLEKASAEKANDIWNEVFSRFANLTSNATNYLAHIKSEKFEELMKTEMFLVYKDKFVDYLRKFILTMNNTSYKIKEALKQTPNEKIIGYINKIIEHQSNMPRLESFDKDKFHSLLKSRWEGLYLWFIGDSSNESDLSSLSRQTDDAIRKITRQAQRFTEIRQKNMSRREDYLYLAKWFNEIGDINEAHLLSAAAFGVFHTQHIYGKEKITELDEDEIWFLDPTIIETLPKTRAYTRRSGPLNVITDEKAKKERVEKYLLEVKKEEALINSMIANGKIVLRSLDRVEPNIRKRLLTWVARAMSTKNHTGKTDKGKAFKLIVNMDKTITLKCKDGNLRMPDVELVFAE